MFIMRKAYILLGKFTEEQLDHLIRSALKIKDTGSRIEFLSRQFIDIDYKESPLIGDINTPEVFVINLEGFDCFTFLEHIEAMRLSHSFSDFRKKLLLIRYKSGIPAYENRNHFFTDWKEYNSRFVDDITESIGGESAVTVKKMLNLKEDGTYFLKGVPLLERNIVYIPSEKIDESVIKKLITGDYVGIYSHLYGLDVSHVGIIIKDNDNILLRHASSEEDTRKVIDQDFREYISRKPGILVLRPLSI